MKAIVIGLDGGTWRLLDKFMGDLPFLSSIKDTGTYGTLKTIIPTGSAAGWTSLSTGKNPGKHGILSWEKKPFTQSIATTSDIKERELWDILSEKMKVGIMCPPISYPPKKVNGFYISGMGRPSINTEFVHPSEDKEDVKNYLEDILISDDVETNKEEVQNKLKETTKKKTELFIKMINKHNCEFGFLLYDETDRMQHFFWNDDMALKEYYMFLDKELRKISEQYPEANLFIVSDHGFHSPPEKYFHINTWLMKNNYIKTGIMGKLKIVLFPLGKKIFGRLFKDGEVPNILKRFVPHQETIIKGMDKKDRSIENADFLAFNNFSLYVKNKDIVDGIRKKLENIEHDGEKIFRHVWLKEEIYNGSLEELPDIVFLMNEKYNINTDFTSNIFSNFTKSIWTGYHTYAQDGILLSFGPDITKGRRDANITDITPTILHLLGEHVPEDCDGKVLKEMLKENKEIKYSKHSKENKQGNELSKEEEEKVKEKLRDLGYM